MKVTVVNKKPQTKFSLTRGGQRHQSFKLNDGVWRVVDVDGAPDSTKDHLTYGDRIMVIRPWNSNTVSILCLKTGRWFSGDQSLVALCGDCAYNLVRDFGVASVTVYDDETLSPEHAP